MDDEREAGETLIETASLSATCARRFRTIPAKHVQGTAQYIDDIREPDGTLHVAIGQSPIARGPLAVARSRCRARASRRRHGTDGRRHPGQERRLAGLRRRSAFCRARDQLPRPGAFRRRCNRPRYRAPRRQGWRDRDRSGAPSITVEDALERGETVMPDYAFGRGDARGRASKTRRAGSKDSFASAGRSISISRADRARDPRRGRRHLRPFLDAASDRGAARGRPGARYPRCLCHLRNAAHGRRFRRQGEPGDAMGRRPPRSRRASRAVHASCASTATTISSSPASATISAATGKSASTRRGASSGYRRRHLARCGYSADLSGGVVDRAMFHSDNAYFLPAVHVGSKRLKTNTVSNTAFRGFGGPQGMLAIEHVMDQIAWATGRDPLDVRYANFYRAGGNLTPFGMEVEENRYAARRSCDAGAHQRLSRAARRRSRRSTPRRRS